MSIEVLVAENMVVTELRSMIYHVRLRLVNLHLVLMLSFFSCCQLRVLSHLPVQVVENLQGFSDPPLLLLRLSEAVRYLPHLDLCLYSTGRFAYEFALLAQLHMLRCQCQRLEYGALPHVLHLEGLQQMVHANAFAFVVAAFVPEQYADRALPYNWRR